MADDQQRSEGAERPRVARPRDYLLFTLVVLFWLIPLAHKGVTHQDIAPSLPRYVRYLHNASCLFTKRVRRFSDYYAEGLRPDGQWVPLRDADYSPLHPSGYRSRMDWILGYNRAYNTPRRRQAQLEEISRWYLERYSDLHPGAPPLEAVRLFYVSYAVGKERAGNEGHWAPVPCEDVPSADKKILITYPPEAS